VFLIQILLPLVTGDTRVDNSKFTETRRELLEKFEGGSTRHPHIRAIAAEMPPAGATR
jgi:hypothetical protein